MQLTRTDTGGVLVMSVDGRVDGYWADHLDAALGDAVREGHHRIALDCSSVSFLSSAGIGVLVKHHKVLAGIKGAFRVVNPSTTVATVLRMTRLADILIADALEFLDVAAPATGVRRARHVEAPGVSLTAFELEPGAAITCRALGTPAPLATGTFTAQDAVNLEGSTPAFAVGVGAFGDSFDDCRARFGELISVSGATAYQPADGTNVADYLVAKGPLGADMHLLYGFAGDGAFSHLVRFEPADRGVLLSQLLAGCLTAAAADAIGIVVVAEAAGLVGASLRRSPAQPLAGSDFFEHPAVRTRLSFSAERTYTHCVTLAAGVVVRTAAIRSAKAVALQEMEPQLRPIGADCLGHFHAAAFQFRPIQKGSIELHDTVANLFEPEQLMGVLHLLHDDRGAVGAGETELIRGACWIAPIA